MKIKIKKKERKEKKLENSTELQKPNVEAEVYNNNKKCDWERKEKKKKLKSLIRFHSANWQLQQKQWVGGEVVRWGGKTKKKHPKESTQQVKT